MISWKYLLFFDKANRMCNDLFWPLHPFQQRRWRGCWGCQSTLKSWGFIKGTKPDFCLSEFSYYGKHLWIWKAIYRAAFIVLILSIQKLHKHKNSLEGTNYYDLAFHSNSASNASFHTVEVWNRNDEGDSFQLVCLGIIKVHFKAALATHW